MKKITLFITVLIFALNTNAQNDLWPTDPINTGSNSTYLVQDVSFNNGNLVYGILGACHKAALLGGRSWKPIWS